MMKLKMTRRDSATNQSIQIPRPDPEILDIPVLIDDVKSLDGFNMTRCTFFTIDAEAAVDDWVALLRGRGIPFLLMGLSALIHRPEVDVRRFSESDQIDSLFNRIEQSGGLVVESGHIWLPNEMFGMYGKETKHRSPNDPAVQRGAVWRISVGLFQMALQFEREVFSSEQYTEDCLAALKAELPALEYSADESDVFRSWSAAQIEAARIQYYRQREEPGRVLQWRDEHGEIHDG
jgi:hypothetical protein